MPEDQAEMSDASPGEPVIGDPDFDDDARRLVELAKTESADDTTEARETKAQVVKEAVDPEAQPERTKPSAEAKRRAAADVGVRRLSEPGHPGRGLPGASGGRGRRHERWRAIRCGSAHARGRCRRRGGPSQEPSFIAGVFTENQSARLRTGNSRPEGAPFSEFGAV